MNDTVKDVLVCSGKEDMVQRSKSMKNLLIKLRVSPVCLVCLSIFLNERILLVGEETLLTWYVKFLAKFWYNIPYEVFKDVRMITQNERKVITFLLVLIALICVMAESTVIVMLAGSIGEVYKRINITVRTLSYLGVALMVGFWLFQLVMYVAGYSLAAYHTFELTFIIPLAYTVATVAIILFKQCATKQVKRK